MFIHVPCCPMFSCDVFTSFFGAMEWKLWTSEGPLCVDSESGLQEMQIPESQFKSRQIRATSQRINIRRLCCNTGWWWLEHEWIIFPFIREWNNHPNWRTHIIFRGVGCQPQTRNMLIYVAKWEIIRMIPWLWSGWSGLGMSHSDSVRDVSFEDVFDSLTWGHVWGEQLKPLEKAISIRRSNLVGYPLVNKHSYTKWPCIVDFPIENGDFP